MTATLPPPVRRTLSARLADDRHSATTTVALHLLPGVVFTAAALPLGRLASTWGLPPAFGLMAACLTVLIPLQLGVIAVAARQRTGSWSLRGGLGFTRRLPTGRLALLAIATMTWAGLVFAVTAPAAEVLQASLFAGWPAELDYAAHLTDPDRFSRGTLIAAWAAGLVVTTLSVPVVEELYFRGFLLPRLEHLGRWAPLLNTVLFALYHLWSPWQAPTRVVATLPLYYATWRTRAVGLAIVVHVALNLVGDTLAGAAVLVP